MSAAPWNSETARAAALKRYAKPPPPMIDLSREAALMQAAELQALLVKDAKDPDTTPTARAQVSRAWKELQEQRRILMGIPLPKPVEVPVSPAAKEIQHSTDAPEVPAIRSAV